MITLFAGNFNLILTTSGRTCWLWTDEAKLMSLWRLPPFVVVVVCLVVLVVLGAILL